MQAPTGCGMCCSESSFTCGISFTQVIARQTNQFD